MDKRHIIKLQGREFARDFLKALIYPPQIVDRGFCQCGCGARANVSSRNEYRRGFIRGEPIPYLPGHNRRRGQSRYVEEDRGFKSLCWIWRSVTGANTYGQLSVNGFNLSAHRVIYSLYRGEVPNGMVLDHLCRQRACVNPEHLEPVSQEENVFRMYVASVAEALAHEISAGGGVYTDIFALEGMKVRLVDAVEP